MATQYPKTLGACVDLLYKNRQERIELQNEVDDMKSREELLKDHILRTFEKSDIEGAKGRLATASVTRRTVPKVTDWEALYTYIRKTGSFDLLHRRASDTAYRARLENNETVPGVEPEIIIGISLNKVGGK